MKLRTKIICGYATILAITCVGTTTGFLIGNNYQRKALENRETASRERKLINQLQIDILYNRPAKQLSPYLNQTQEFQRASTAFQNRLIRIKILLANHNNSGVPATLPGLQSLLEDYEVKVDPEIVISEYMIPPMLLQPYVENAVWHGLRYKKEIGLLSILFQKVDSDSIQITIRDNGIGREKSKALKTENQKKQQSKGMSNIKKRISILNTMYKDKIDVFVTDLMDTEEGTEVKVILKKD